MDSVRELEVIEFPDFPRSLSIMSAHLPTIMKKYKESDLDWRIVRDGLLANFPCWGCVFNSFEAHLRGKLGHNRVYGVGPLGLIGKRGSQHLARMQRDSDTANSLFNWLDDQPRRIGFVCLLWEPKAID
ncbi:UDP-glycosyltransferase 89B2-like protein [Drosera capensis]